MDYSGVCYCYLRNLLGQYPLSKSYQRTTRGVKKQYDEQNRAYITFAFIYEKRSFYGVRFTNHGHRVARKVKIILRKEFINSLTENRIKTHLESISEKECVLGVEQSFDVYFGGNEFRENRHKIPIEGDIIYSDDISEYCEHFVIDFDNYPPIFTVNTETEDICEEMKKQTKELEQLRREVAAIKHDPDQLVN